MGVSASAVSRVTGIEVTPKNFNTGKASMLPQRLVIIGQGNDDTVYTTEKYECEGSAAAVAEKYGYGSPLHLAIKQLYPTAGAMATFPVSIIAVQKASGSVAATGSILVTGANATAAAACSINIGGEDIEFAVSKGDTPATVLDNILAAITANTDKPVTAAYVAATENTPAYISLTAKWSGALGNRIPVIINGDVPGLTVAITAMADGAGTPAVDDALASIGEVWETFVLNTFDYKNADGTASSLLDTYQVWGEGRWSVLEKKPVMVCSGCVDSYAVRTAVTDERTTDYVNFLAVSVGAPELPFVVAARALLDILTTADKNPAQNYKGTLTGIKRGSDAVQENYTVRNMSVQKGSSTNITNGSVAELNDTITMYHPAGSGKFPMRQHVVDAVKLANIVFNLRLITESDEVKGAPLVPDEQVTTNPTALQPKTFRTWFANLANSLGLNALISDVDFTVENLEVTIDSENPKRVNYTFPVKLSGNVEVVSGDVYFGQYLG